MNKDFTAGNEFVGERLDVAVCKLCNDITRNRVQKLLADGHILVNGQPGKANYRVRESDQISVKIPPMTEAKADAQQISLEVLYEDEDVIVINKPKGMVVHPACGHRDGTLVNALLYHCKNLSGIGGEERPGIVHRLDKDTSGVLVVAKNDKAHLSLSRQFKEHSVNREYVAMVFGNVKDDSGTITGNISRHPRERKKMAVTRTGTGRTAVTNFSVLERFKTYTYISLQLKTGRTHQIRVHLSSLGHPVVGDPMYGPKRPKINYAGQALHARLLGFRHPADEKYLEFSSPVPADFQNLLTKLRRERGE